MRKYFNESHKAYSEACQKEVEEMSKHPMTESQFREQCHRNRVDAIRSKKLVFLNPEGTVITGNHNSALKKAGNPLSDEFGPAYDPETLRNLLTVFKTVSGASIVFLSRQEKRTRGRMKGAWLRRLAPGFVIDYIEVKGDSPAAQGEAIREFYRANGVEEKDYEVFCDKDEFLPNQA